MRKKMLAAGIVTVVMVGLSAPALAKPGAADAPQITGLESPLRVAAGATPTDEVTVEPVDSTVELQRNDAGSWVPVKTFRPTAAGIVSLRYPTAESGVQGYRVIPTAADVSGDPQPVEVIGYQRRATLEGWPTEEIYVRKGEQVVRRLTASPAGAQVELQSRASGSWKVVQTMRVRDDGTLRVDLGKVGVGTTPYRLVIPHQDLVQDRYLTSIWRVTGYSTPPRTMLPDILNRLVRPLGIPKVEWPGVASGETARAVCVARELSGMKPRRSNPSPALRAKWMGTKPFRKAPKGMVDGVNVDITCQAAYFVKRGKILRAVPVSTGRAAFPTGRGTYRIYRGVNGTETSLQFPDDHWNMYRSLYFNGGEALHGSWSDEYVLTYPDSHGCVRMLHRDVDWLWSNGWTVGTTVRVYGSWK